MKPRSGSISPVTTAKVLSLIILSSALFIAPNITKKGDSAVIDYLETIDWDERHPIEFYGTLLDSLAEAYPKVATTYSIGHSWRERPIWCIEISSVSSRNKKVEVAVIGNIHGGEKESGESAAYVAWWLIMNYDNDPTAKQVLDNYIVYVVPVMNPDGYAYNTRSNLRPLDKDGNGISCDDPRVDVDGDGYISRLYQGPADTPAEDLSSLPSLGYESLDWNRDGIFGNDDKPSGIDLNRNFDYMWGRLDIDEDPMIGSKGSESSRGPDAASEPETRFIQDFLASKNIKALATLHTGIQCVLWPWCYTEEDPIDGAYMQATSEAMADAFSESTGKNYYAMQSYEDYPTTSELIDYSYGRLGIYSYTVEVYSGGTGTYDWGNPRPDPRYIWEYVGDWADSRGTIYPDVWLRKSLYSGLPQGDLHLVCEGNLAAMLVMFESVPPTPTIP